MPRYYNQKTQKWVKDHIVRATASDTRRPCALCGWGPHMGIHGVPDGTKPTGPLGLHSWVSPYTPPAQADSTPPNKE